MTKLIRKNLFAQLALILFCVLSLTVTSLHADQMPESNIAEGRRLYAANCTACHGLNAEGNKAITSPALSGQNEAYLNRQMEYFSKGIRGASVDEKPDIFARQMAAVATLLKTSQARADLSTYLASLPAPTTSVTDAKTGGGTANGYKYYQSSCGACHGGDIMGNERLNAPSLAGLSAAYLKRQYQNFLSGRRGSHQEDKLGRQMRMMANTMTEQKNIDDVIAYIVSLNHSPTNTISE